MSSGSGSGSGSGSSQGSDNESEIGDLFISVSGSIAVGKTTVCESLHELIDESRWLQEPVVRNPFLEGFYANKKEYSLRLQLFFLCERYKQQRSIEKSITSDTGPREAITLIQDRNFWEDPVFARTQETNGDMTREDYALYRDLFSIMEEEARIVPQCVIFLDASPETCLERIKLR